MQAVRITILVLLICLASFNYYQISKSKKNSPPAVVSKKNINTILLDPDNTDAYNVKINPPGELDFLTKEEVFDIRKKYVSMSPELIDQNYSPSAEVYGHIISKKPWWGQQGINCRGNGQHSIDGVSEESRFINNPLLLLGVDTIAAMVIPGWNCTDFYPEPVELIYQPGNKRAVVVYNFSDFLHNIKNTDWERIGPPYDIKADNARDFGYNYGFVYNYDNVTFERPDNISTQIYRFKNFLHTGGSCGYTGGCNNGSPHQPEIIFEINSFPANIRVKLWKEKPVNTQAEPDLYFDMVFKS